MLQFVNLTPLAAQQSFLTEPSGNYVMVTAIKATYDLSEPQTPVLASDQEPIVVAPVFLGEVGQSTMLRPSDLGLDHDGTDVIVNASAHAPGGQPVQRMNVCVDVDGVVARIVVTGDRRWQRSGNALRPSAPATFVRMPLVYERAFGGSDGAEEDPRNPVGVGFCTDLRRLDGQLLPNLEDPDALVTQAKTRMRPPVAGFSAIPAHWEPRLGLSGTFDATWQGERFPDWPTDTDRRHLRVATPALCLTRTLRGHETVTLQGLTPDGDLRFRVPRLIPTLRSLKRSGWVDQSPVLRRMLIEPDLGKLVLMWRATLDLGRSPRAVTRSTLDLRRLVRAGETASIA